MNTLINFLSITLIFVPYIAIPGLVISTSYIQPFSLIPAWITILFLNKINLKFNINNLFIFLIFIFYIYIIHYLYYGTQNLQIKTLLIAYSFGLVQYYLFNMLFFKSLQKKKLYFLIENALLIIPIISCFSMILDLYFPGIFNLFKSKASILSDIDNNIIDTILYRGPEGIFPESSYMGFVCASTIVILFFLQLTKNIYSKINSGEILNKFLINKIYTNTLSKFIRNKKIIISFLFSIISTFLSFSFASLLCFFFLISIIFTKYLFQIVYKKINKYLLIILVISPILIILCLSIISTFFPDNRLSELLDEMRQFQNILIFIVEADTSAAVRFNSTLIGILSPIFYPLGLGLNGLGSIMKDCSNVFVEKFNLLCGTDFNAFRNHNAFANFTGDAGIIGIIYLIFLISPQNSFQKLFKNIYGEYLFLVFYVILILVIMPSPLGSPSPWGIYASIAVFLNLMNYSEVLKNHN